MILSRVSLSIQINPLLRKRTRPPPYQTPQSRACFKCPSRSRPSRRTSLSTSLSWMQSSKTSCWRISHRYCSDSSLRTSASSTSRLTSASMSTSLSWISKGNSPSITQRKIRFGRRWVVLGRIKKNVFQDFKESKICLSSKRICFNLMPLRPKPSLTSCMWCRVQVLPGTTLQEWSRRKRRRETPLPT